MSDIVARLRAYQGMRASDANEAADRIELLEAALRVIVDNTVHEPAGSVAESICLIAIQALK
jgi:hypothetical protein